MSIQQRIYGFYDLGQFFLFFTGNEITNTQNQAKYSFLSEDFQQKLQATEWQNPWFTESNLKYCLESWGNLLKVETLSSWIETYSIASNPKNVGIIMAGNIPLVGFHDLLAVVLSGHNAFVKTSSKDDVLMNWCIEFLKNSDPLFNTAITKVERLGKMDAVIATGSNNTARYFEFYFKDIPHIIRKNRTSVAVLDGTESSAELELLSEDIFRYFGLGCRNITKLYLPKDYNTNILFEAFYPWNFVINHTKYANNYDYNRAIYLMEQTPFLDNNFVLLRESNDFHSPIGVVHYEYYDDLNAIKVELLEQEEKIQCMVGHGLPVKFGTTQKPSLTDYADGIDTLKFLENL